MEQVSICPHLGQNERLPIHIHTKPQKRVSIFPYLASGCHEIIVIYLIRNIGDHAALQVVLPQQASHIMEQGCGTPMDTATVATDSSANDAFPVQHFSPRHTQGLYCSFVVNSISDQFVYRRYLSQMLHVQVQHIITLVA